MSTAYASAGVEYATRLSVTESRGAAARVTGAPALTNRAAAATASPTRMPRDIFNLMISTDPPERYMYAISTAPLNPIDLVELLPLYTKDCGPSIPYPHADCNSKVVAPGHLIRR